MARSYQQYCGLAAALDVVGDRWTLLVVRQLLLGPQRYTDLERGLPGVATNLLAQRLRHLESTGVVSRRRLAPPAASTVYELTEQGGLLEDAILALGRFGARHLPPPGPDETTHPDWLVLGMLCSCRSSRSVDTATYGLHIDERVYRIRIDDGTARASRGHADDPDLTVRGGFEILEQLLTGQVDADTALTTGAIELDGDPTALDTFLHAFRIDRLLQTEG